MLTAVLAAFHLDSPDSLKRALVTLMGGAVLLAAPLLASHGIPVPSDGVLEVFAGLVAAFVLQSGAKAAVVAHAEAIAATPAPSLTEAQKALTEAVAAGAK